MPMSKGRWGFTRDKMQAAQGAFLSVVELGSRLVQ